MDRAAELPPPTVYLEKLLAELMRYQWRPYQSITLADVSALLEDQS